MNRRRAFMKNGLGNFFFNIKRKAKLYIKEYPKKEYKWQFL
jgi:hypothetical protein